MSALPAQVVDSPPPEERAMFRIVAVLDGPKGYKNCRTDPPHPKRYPNGRYRLHRVVMENKLGRLLRLDEHVHHRDGDRTNNCIENLEIVNPSEHARMHQQVPKVPCACPCGRTFELVPCKYRDRIKKSKNNQVFCSHRCAARFGRWIVFAEDLSRQEAAKIGRAGAHHGGSAPAIINEDRSR